MPKRKQVSDRYQLDAGPLHFQWAGDMLALTEDVPMRVLHTAKLARLPAICVGLLNRQPDLAKAFNAQFGMALKDGLPAHADEFDRYIADFLDTIGEVLDETHAVLDEHMPPGGQVLDGTLSVRLTSEIEALVSRRGDQLRSTEADRRRKHIRFLLPYLEGEIWRTHSSNTLPLNLLLRLTPAWRWFSLLWLYREFRRRWLDGGLADGVPDPAVIEDVWGLPGLRLRVHWLDRETAVCFGPLYDYMALAMGRRLEMALGRAASTARKNTLTG